MNGDWTIVVTCGLMMTLTVLGLRFGGSRFWINVMIGSFLLGAILGTIGFGYLAITRQEAGTLVLALSCAGTGVVILTLYRRYRATSPEQSRTT